MVSTWGFGCSFTFAPHELANVEAEKCLDDNGGGHSNTKVDNYTCKTTVQGPANQEWFEDAAPAK